MHERVPPQRLPPVRVVAPPVVAVSAAAFTRGFHSGAFFYSLEPVSLVAVGSGRARQRTSAMEEEGTRNFISDRGGGPCFETSLGVHNRFSL